MSYAEEEQEDEEEDEEQEEEDICCELLLSKRPCVFLRSAVCPQMVKIGKKLLRYLCVHFLWQLWSAFGLSSTAAGILFMV